MCLFGAFHLRGWKKAPFLKSVTHPGMMNLCSYTLPKEDPIKSKNHGTHPLSSADIINFSPEVGKFCYTDID